MEHVRKLIIAILMILMVLGSGTAILSEETGGVSGSEDTGPVNVLSIHEGAYPVVKPGNYGGWYPECLLDGSASSGWASTNGKINDNVFVFELGWMATFEEFEFDNASVDEDGASAKDILVEVSSTSRDSGYTTVLTATLADKTAGQKFKAASKIPARWVRLTIRNNYGSETYTELFTFRGFGGKAALPAPKDISGTFQTTYSDFHVRQQGSALTGCYEYGGGLLEGTIEGRIMKITWRENGGPDDFGPAVMLFAEDGNSFQGYWWHKNDVDGEPSGTWVGTRKSSAVGGCPHWSGSVGGELKKQLSGEKRARLYGILFDFNAASIRAESRPVLDEVVDLLKSEPEWKLLIEGHTDSIGADDRNMTLSQQRAESVKSYLVEKGIEAGRLTTRGFGESKPVADNGTELGRAQNRRVELVRE